VPEQTYQGTHRHRAPLGWHPPRVQPESNGEAGPPPGDTTAAFMPTFTGELPIITDEAQSDGPSAGEQAVAPDAEQSLKRWTFVLVVAAVWIVAAAIGLGLYYWWFHSIDKTPAVFVVLLYLVLCTVAALIAAMVQDKPLMSALGIALMSAPFASTAAAAGLYGIYFCELASRCLVGLIPY
jgi:hypothetical protein